MSARSAGILIPLFSLRSVDDFERGEIGGLVEFGELALAMGQRLIQLLPIDETPAGDSSPYSAMSVFAIDPAYISARDLPGLDAEAIAAARIQVARSSFELVRIRRVKDELLSVAFRGFKSEGDGERRAAFNAFVAAHHGWLDDYALFRVLKDQFRDVEWARWPEGLSRRDAQAIAEARRTFPDLIEEVKFVQFEAQRQWLAVREQLARRGVALGGDLAFSPARDSVEVWAHQELFDLTRSVGAPPDAFSPTGQRWHLPMPDWKQMRASGFAFIRRRVRRALELYDFLRVDHVVGLFRTFGYRQDEPAGRGSFDPPSERAQQAQGEEILRVILKEAGPMRITAEDLGLIPPFVRETLARLGIPGYKIARWEREWTAPDQPFIKPAKYPVASLVTTGTHDTDTLGEWWESIDVQERRDFLTGMGIGDASAAIEAHLGDRTLELILEALYASPAELAILPIQDLFGWQDRINVPGMIDPGNWTWRLPFDPARAMGDSQLRVRIMKIREIAIRTKRFKPAD